jgi:MFS family permease
VNVLALGCFIWGTTTLMFSFTSNVGWGAFAWAWNGVGLSFVIPNTQSLVADYYTEDNRGAAFGTLATTGACVAATCRPQWAEFWSDAFVFLPCK